MIGAHVLGRQASDVALNDLADFLFERHARKQGLHALLNGRVSGERPVGGRPDRWVSGGAEGVGRCLLRSGRGRRRRSMLSLS